MHILKLYSLMYHLRICQYIYEFELYNLLTSFYNKASIDITNIK